VPGHVVLLGRVWLVMGVLIPDNSQVTLAVSFATCAHIRHRLGGADPDAVVASVDLGHRSLCSEGAQLGSCSTLGPAPRSTRILHHDWACAHHLLHCHASHGPGCTILVLCMHWLERTLGSRVSIAVSRLYALEDGRGGDGSRRNLMTTRSHQALVRHFDSARSLDELRTTAHDLLHPVVLEGVLIGIEAFLLGDHLNFTVVVRRSSIGGNDSSFKVSVLEVSAIVVARRSFLLGRFPLLRRLGGVRIVSADFLETALIHRLDSCISQRKLTSVGSLV